MSRNVILAFSGPPNLYIKRRDFYALRAAERGKVEEKERIVLICGDLLWISISVTRG